LESSKTKKQRETNDQKIAAMDFNLKKTFKKLLNLLKKNLKI
jgi:hypothetical protein